jgi:hypothetical protein
MNSSPRIEYVGQESHSPTVLYPTSAAIHISAVGSNNHGPFAHSTVIATVVHHEYARIAPHALFYYRLESDQRRQSQTTFLPWTRASSSILGRFSIACRYSVLDHIDLSVLSLWKGTTDSLQSHTPWTKEPKSGSYWVQSSVHSCCSLWQLLPCSAGGETRDEYEVSR